MPNKEMASRVWIVNGQRQQVEFGQDERLLDVLRRELGLTSIKEGCAEGECGACSVLINGELRLSCLEIASLLPDETNILTAEGIGQTRTGKVLQESFLRCGAVQCGFCTPGMIVAAYWYIESKPSLTPKDAMSGNFCRCTGYKKIVAAIEVAQQILDGKDDGLIDCGFDR